MWRAILLCLALVSVSRADHVLFDLQAPFSIPASGSYSFAFSTGDGVSLSELFSASGNETFLVPSNSSTAISQLTGDLLRSERKDDTSFVLNGAFVPVRLGVSLSGEVITNYEVTKSAIDVVNGAANFTVSVRANGHDIAGAVPEPSSLGLICGSLVCLARRGWRKTA
jgi:hypothetical protein